MTVVKNRTEIKGAAGEIALYRAKDGRTAVDVRLEKETIWLTQKDMAALFAAERSVITKHIRNILNINELNSNSVCAIFAHTAADAVRTSDRDDISRLTVLNKVLSLV